MSKRMPTRQDAEKEILHIVDRLTRMTIADPADARLVRELAEKLRRLAKRESLPSVFCAVPAKRPVGRQPTPRQKIIDAQKRVLAGETQAAAAQAAGVNPRTLSGHIPDGIWGMAETGQGPQPPDLSGEAQTGQSAGTTVATGTVVNPPSTPKV